MDSPRNIQFTKLIKIDGRQREFNFRKRTSHEYDVDTSDERGNRIMFKLVKMEDNWTMQSDNTTGWLIQYGKEIAAVIINYESQ
jgi:hypothetical protein